MPGTQRVAEAGLLTTEEVIERLLEDATLRRVAATCVLPAVRFGDSWRFRRTDLDAWIERQQFPIAARA